jgi:phosphatidylglycerophosphate synthase
MDKILAPFGNLKISPNRVSWLSLLLSIFVYFAFQKHFYLVSVMLLFFVLFLDALDGFLARKKKIASFKGLIVDTSCDRLSELIIFFPFKLWILLAAMNVFITLLRLKDKNVFILPLRHFFLILMIVGATIGFEKINFLLI